MAGKRQPTALVEANGRKHLTAAEADARRDQEVYVAPPEAAVPPLWLPKKLHKEFREIGEILLAAGLYSELDRDVLGQYFLARERWLRADKLASQAIRDKDENLGPEMGKHPEHLLSPGSANVRSPWGSPSQLGAGSSSRRPFRMPEKPDRRTASMSSRGSSGPGRRRAGGGGMPTVTATAETIQDKAAGKFVCDFVSRLPTTDSGQPFQLYEWQRDAIMDFYGTMEDDLDHWGTAAEVLVSLPGDPQEKRQERAGGGTRPLPPVCGWRAQCGSLCVRCR